MFFLPWKIHSLSNHCARNRQCASKPLSYCWRDSNAAYRKCSLKTKLCSLFILSQISWHHSESLEIVSVMNVAPRGTKDIWMWKRVEGSPQCTGVTEQKPLRPRSLSCLSLKIKPNQNVVASLYPSTSGQHPVHDCSGVICCLRPYIIQLKHFEFYVIFQV